MTGSQPILELRVNHGRRVTANRGTPLRFDVTLTAATDARITVGSRWTPWYRRIRLELEDGQHQPWALQDAPSASSTSFFRNSDGQLGATRELLSAAVLGGGQIHAIAFNVPPETTATGPAGRYRVRAVLEMPFWAFWTWRGHVSSIPVSVDMRDADRSLETSRLATAAAYYLRQKRFDAARPVVEELVRRVPDRAGPQQLLGQLLEGLGDAQRAIDAYTRALQLAPRTYEDRNDLLDRIGRLTVNRK